MSLFKTFLYLKNVSKIRISLNRSQPQKYLVLFIQGSVIPKNCFWPRKKTSHSAERNSIFLGNGFDFYILMVCLVCLITSDNKVNECMKHGERPDTLQILS